MAGWLRQQATTTLSTDWTDCATSPRHTASKHPVGALRSPHHTSVTCWEQPALFIGLLRFGENAQWRRSAVGKFYDKTRLFHFNRPTVIIIITISGYRGTDLLVTATATHSKDQTVSAAPLSGNTANLNYYFPATFAISKRTPGRCCGVSDVIAL